MSALRFPSQTIWTCQQCGSQQRNIYPWYLKKYCSKPCYSQAMRSLGGPLNHNYQGKSGIRKCEMCKEEFWAERQSRKFCSPACKHRASRNDHRKTPRPSVKHLFRGNCRRDNNHQEIVQALKGCGFSVRELVQLGQGCPDLVVGKLHKDYLVEIKNPKTAYGKNGLSKTQQKFAKEWRGGPIYVLSSIADVEAFANGKLEDSKIVQSAGAEMIPAELLRRMFEEPEWP